MQTFVDAAYTLHPEDYEKSIATGEEFYIQFHLLSDTIDSKLVTIIHRYLEQYDIIYIQETILTIIRELINNSVKANIKRIFFKKKKLKINSPEEYRKGMDSFKKEVFETDETSFYAKLEESNLIVRVSFKTTGDHIHINVINNIPILEWELDKIEARIDKAYRYNDISEAFDDVLDDSEGAGLGLIMTLMLLKNIGLSRDAFKIYKKNDLTISSLTVPKSFTPKEKQIKIMEELEKEIQDIPSFPDSIREIQELCDAPDSSMDFIAQAISKDPGIAASVMKLANSASYMTSGSISTIHDAVTHIGLTSIHSLLTAAGVSTILESKYRQFASIWENSKKRAFLAGKLAHRIEKRNLADKVYLAALMADTGLIIIRSLNPKRIRNLMSIIGNKAMEDSGLIEEITLGISHSTLAARVCKKWNFSEDLIAAIDFHHKPYIAPKEYREMIYIVNMSDALVESESGRVHFDIVDEDVLTFFNIKSPEEFISLHKELMKDYSLE